MIPTLKQRTNLPEAYGPLAAELAGAHLEQEDGEPHAAQGDDVGNKKCTCKQEKYQLYLRHE